MLSPALRNLTTYGVSHQADVLVQPEAQNSSSFMVILITIQPPGLGEFHGFLGVFCLFRKYLG